MAINTILACNDGGDGATAGLKLAFRIAEGWNAHLEVMHVRLDSRSAVPLLGEGMSGAMIDEMIHLSERDAKERSEKAAALFKQIKEEANAEVAGRTVYREIEGIEDDVVARRGRMFDLIVCPQPMDKDSATAGLVLNAALFETGRPVLVAPTGALPPVVGKSVAVIWNGSAEAGRALSAAMPILRQADQIHVLTAVSSVTDAKVNAEVVEVLNWGGLKANPVVIDPGNRAVGEALYTKARELDVDMIVTGAYTHARLWQMILGGVTSFFLEHCQLPMLMAR